MTNYPYRLKSTVTAAMLTLLLSVSVANSDPWQAMPLKVPGGAVGEIRQVGQQVFVHAGGRWMEITSCAVHRFCFTPRKPPARTKAPAAGLPDGHVVSVAAMSGPVAAWYESPTKTYAHGILGDAVEAAVLAVKTADGKLLAVNAGQGHVFEDLTPRLADLDDNGDNEVIAIRSDVHRGAAVAVYGIREGALELLASTPPVGLANRWRNPSLIVDDPAGQGRLIGEVVTPHIGGTLKLWSLAGTAQAGFQLEQRGSAKGFSNHAIGSRQLGLSAASGKTIAVPSADRQSLRVLNLATGGPEAIADIRLPGRIEHAVGVIREDENPLFVTALSDGRLFSIGLQNSDYYCIANQDDGSTYFMVAEDQAGKRREFLAAPGRHWCVPRSNLKVVWVFEDEDAIEGCSHLVNGQEAGLDLVQYASFDNCRWSARQIQ